MNNMGREIMAALKRFQVGSDGDGVTVGGNLVVSGSSTLATTAISSADINGGTIDGTAIGGASAAAGAFTTLNTSGQVVFNDAGADVDFRVEGDTDANLLFVDASADAVGIGTSSPAYKLDIRSAQDDATNFLLNGLNIVNTSNQSAVANKTAIRLGVLQDAGVRAAKIVAEAEGGSTTNNIALSFRTNTADAEDSTTERARITSGGHFLVGKTTSNFNNAGTDLYPNGEVNIVRDADIPLYIRRNTNDGVLISFYQANAEEGTISVSGNTVSYNPFLGSHSGALTDWSRPEIKVGTVMDTINELLEYKVVVIDVQEDVPAKDAVLDEEGNEVEPAQEATTQTVQRRISYNGNGAVGSIATVEYEGEEYTGTIQHEREEPLSFNKHLKVKINDTAASKTVFGVFVSWNNDSNNDGGIYNDMLVGAVGNYVIRMAAGQTPEAGDLVEADGNGCAVVQDDDIIRTKTIAKVTSTIPQVTYDDGSFLVTCVLYCG
jgi:hypothetical protein